MNSNDKEKIVSLNQQISEKYPSLSRKEKKIADFILQNFPAAFALSAAHLANKTGTSSATIVRFAQHLGFTGFQQFRLHMLNEAKEEMMPEDRFKLLSPKENQISTVLKIAELEVKSINDTLQQLDRAVFKRFIAGLNKGRCVYSLGIGISSLLARLSAYQLNQAGLKTHFCAKDEHSFLEKLIHLTPKDVLLAFSFPPYSKETVRAVQFCRERGIQCLAVTDRTTAPIVRFSQETLLVKTRNLMFTNSVSAAAMLINAVATEIALLNKKRVVAEIDLMNELLSQEFLS
ncbi:MAG: MurR/RpiR family transcriptional regulator [Candidatus Aminicenantales bacterium]